MSDSGPMITAVIPTFRRPQLLSRAISSVLGQRDVSLQVCVLDNASGDETSDVVASMMEKDDRIIYHRHAANIGGLANFEFGMSRVDTPFFSLLSDDDYLLPSFYRHALDGFARNADALCWAGMTLNVDEAGVIWDARVRAWPREGLFSPPEGFMRMTGGMAPVWTGILFRREVLHMVGMPDRKVLGPSDLEYLLRLAARHPYILSKHPSAVFTLNSASFSATQPLSSFWPGWKRMLLKLEEDDSLDFAFKRAAMAALRKDAKKMLFRRGANALAADRLDFALDAAEAMDVDCGMTIHASFLRLIARGCAHSTLLQNAYVAAYRWAEWRIIHSRSALQSEYGGLLRSE